jgi:hypothetical protein
MKIEEAKMEKTKYGRQGNPFSPILKMRPCYASFFL